MRRMWIDEDRIFYAGLLGLPSPRLLGACALYVALEGEVSLALNGENWQVGELAFVPAQATHRIACSGQLIGVLHLEPETFAPRGLPEVLAGPGGIVYDAEMLRRVRSTYAMLCAAPHDAVLGGFDFDQTLFGRHLIRRVIDPRIAEIVDWVKRHPEGSPTAEDCASRVGLSASRFLHLFTTEVGISFRGFRSWKRARSLLYHVTRPAQMTDVAMSAGYPDASHFSHSIRQVFGLRPKEIFAGSRRLVVHGPPPKGSESH